MIRTLLALVAGGLWVQGGAADEPWPALPEKDGAMEIPAQEWSLRPGERKVRVLVHYPQGMLANVGKQTGVMLTLHNWGGTDCVGTANPKELADKLNVVAICVNYLQSGKKDSIDGPEAYDFGYLQALDALRALYFVQYRLKEMKRDFAEGRTYCTGGSGGGNVTLMANKLAPRTFACVVDLCGMKKLSDDIAFNLPGGSDLNARYSRDPKNPNYLSLDHQELRYLGNPDHLTTMKSLGHSTKIISVHGADDTTCPFADALEMAHWMTRAKLNFETRWIAKKDLDGAVFTSSGHALGDRTKIVFQVAGKYLLPDSPDRIVRVGVSDFDQKDEVRYRTSHGEFVISYAKGFPVGRFEELPAVPKYDDHTDVMTVLNREGKLQPIEKQADWSVRRDHIRRNLERVMGPFPSPMKRVPLDVKVVDEVRVEKLLRRKLTYQSDPTDRVSAYLLLPVEKTTEKMSAMLCLHQTTKFGKDEPAGVRGDPEMKYALELAQRGYIVIVPDYPSLGEHEYDFAERHGYVSGTMKAIWDNVRAIDLLESLPEVDMDRIGVIGHSLGGHNAMFTAVFEPRLKVIISSCGFSSMRKDDVPSWNGPRYMPRIKTEFKDDVNRLPFDFHEIVASFAPRPFLACAATMDNDFDVSGVRDVIQSASGVYKLHDAQYKIGAYYPKVGHSFPESTRKAAYAFLDQELARRKGMGQ